MRVRVESVDPFLPKLQWEIDALPAIIGHSKAADMQITDRRVSGKHCELFIQEGELTIRDISSDEGILVNGSAVSTFSLQTDDTATIGFCFLRVAEINDSEQPCVPLEEALP